MLYRGQTISAPIACVPNKSSVFCDCVLGFQIVDKDAKKQDENEKPKDVDGQVFPEDGAFATLSFLGDLLNTFMYPAEDGQIRSRQEEQYTIQINSSGLSTIDFASPKLNEKRASFYAKRRETKLAEKNEELFELKEYRIGEAETETDDRIS